jgi:hypothetical protein
MRINDYLQRIRRIRIPQKGFPVERTIAKEFVSQVASHAVIQPVEIPEIKSSPNVINIAVATRDVAVHLSKIGISPPRNNNLYLKLDKNQCVWLLSGSPQFLFSGYTYLIEESFQGVDNRDEWNFNPAFKEEKSTFDLFLTQYARLIRDFDRKGYVREYARLGFTQIEVNALATPFPYEQGVPGEFYPDFYTYCPALDQFVSSRLNQGIYPDDYLRANLDILKENAALAVEYGLKPGLLVFEPRSVPEEIFKKYPTLRGARVDHPFRSFKPRYNLSIVHPVVQEHYAEMIRKLLSEVPQLSFLSIWTNDSGAGFEHTKSLYVGRNGGAYLIREWKDDDQIAGTAADNVIKFFRLLKRAAAEINPEFRVITRLEPFYGERKHLWPEIKDGIDVETNSLLAEGWENIYPHPRYNDIKVSGSALQNTLNDEEQKKMDELKKRSSRCYFYHMFASHTNHEPLLGIPFPWLTYEKLRSAFKIGAEYMAHVGGIHPPDKVPYAVNQEIFRLFQLNSDIDIDESVRQIGVRYVGKKFTDDLVKGWRFVEEAIRSFVPLSIYTHYGAVWQRLLIRPLVPDIDGIPEELRAYYEKFMCTSIHNPNRVDLAKDVLFELIQPEYALESVKKINSRVWTSLEKAQSILRKKAEECKQAGEHNYAEVFFDQYYRTWALNCLFRSLRNAADWIYSVHAYLGSDEAEIRGQCLNSLKNLIEDEIDNSKNLLQLWETASCEWMILSGSEETPFIYKDNLPELVKKKIELMEAYKDREPRIDPDYMFRIKNDPYKRTKEY